MQVRANARGDYCPRRSPLKRVGSTFVKRVGPTREDSHGAEIEEGIASLVRRHEMEDGSDTGGVDDRNPWEDSCGEHESGTTAGDLSSPGRVPPSHPECLQLITASSTVTISAQAVIGEREAPISMQAGRYSKTRGRQESCRLVSKG